MVDFLWKSSDPERFFLIPGDVALPPGDLTIRSLTGKLRRVDGSSIAPYERSEGEATEWMKARVGNMLEGVRGWLDNAVDHLTGADSDPVSALREAADRAEHLAEKVLADRSSADAEVVASIAAKLRRTAKRLTEGDA